MSSYTFTVLDITAEPYAASPELTARLRIEESTGTVVHAVALRTQVRIEPQRRGYSANDETGLRTLFGERERWRDTLKPFLWMHCSSTVQGFTGATEVDLPMPCTYDFDVAASRYLHALDGGSIPLSLTFSGTIFTRGARGVEVERVPWECAAAYQLPADVWHRMIELHFPRTGWIRLDREVLTEVARYRDQHGLTDWEETMRRLLACSEEALR